MLPAGPKSKDAGQAAVPTAATAVEWCTLTQGKPYAWQAPLIEGLSSRYQRPRIAYVQVGRKNGKSRTAASIAIEDMCVFGKQVFLIADSERNLKSALFFEICTLIKRSKILTACCVPYKDHIECPTSGGMISLRPSNLSASQSINPDTVVFDEVHMQDSDQIWNGMFLAGAAMPNAMLLGITTPGYNVTSLAHDLYQQVKAGTLLGKIYEPSDPDCRLDDPAALIESNPILADRPDMRSVFEYERENLPEHDFRRFRLGQWTTAASAWLPYGHWDSLKVERALEPGEAIWLGFDGSFSGDSTGLVAVTADGFVSVVACWEAPGRKGWRVPREEVLDAVDAAFATYDVQAMLADPPYWQREILDWDRKYPGKIIEFPTFSRARMAPACTTFYAAALEGKLSHDGDPRLARHISNTVVKNSPQGDYVTKADKDSPAKIDLAIAGIIAVSHARLVKPRANPIFVL